MSSAAEMFVGEQVRDAVNKKYPELSESWIEAPKWVYDVWDEAQLPSKFTVEVGEAEPTTTIEVTVGFEVDGDDCDGRYIVAYVKEVNIVGKTT